MLNTHCCSLIVGAGTGGDRRPIGPARRRADALSTRRQTGRGQLLPQLLDSAQRRRRPGSDAVPARRPCPAGGCLNRGNYPLADRRTPRPLRRGGRQRPLSFRITSR